MDRATAFINEALGRRYWALAAVFASMAGVFSLRLLAMGSASAGGIDYGHYLATAHWMVGQEPTQFGNEGLPGFSLLLIPLILLFPEPTATVLAGPMVVATLVPAAYFLSRLALRPLPALCCATLLALQQNISDMIAWGGNPNLLAMAFSLVAWRYFIQLGAPTHARFQRRQALTCGVFLGLVVVTHSFTAFIVLLMVGVFSVALIAMRMGPLRLLIRHALLIAAVAAIVAVPAAPMYFTHLQSATLAQASDSTDPLSRTALLLEYLFRDTAALWLAVGALAVAGAVLVGRRRDPFGAFLLVSWTVPLVLALSVLAGLAGRVLYFLDIPLVLGLGVAGAALWERKGALARIPEGAVRGLVATLCVALLLFVPASAYQREVLAVDFYNKLTPQHLEAFEWLRENSNRSDAVWTSGSRELDREGRSGQPYGFWIEGYARRAALFTSSPEAMAFDYQRRDAAEALRVLQGDRGAENGALRVGVGADISVPVQPTIGVRSGSDYRPMISGEVLGLEAGARIYWLDQGVNKTNGSSAQQGTEARFWSNVTFNATNNWTGGALATTVLNASTLSYTVEATGDRGIIPWIHQEFRTSPHVRLLGEVLPATEDKRVFSFDIPGAAAGDPSAFTVEFRAPRNGTLINVSARTFGDEVRLNAVVSGRVQRPVLEVAFSFQGGEARVAEGQAPLMFEAGQILSNYSVRFLFIEQLQSDLVRRFALQPSAYRAAFSNSAVAIFELRGMP